MGLEGSRRQRATLTRAGCVAARFGPPSAANLFLLRQRAKAQSVSRRAPYHERAGAAPSRQRTTTVVALRARAFVLWGKAGAQPRGRVVPFCCSSRRRCPCLSTFSPAFAGAIHTSQQISKPRLSTAAQSSAHGRKRTRDRQIEALPERHYARGVHAARAFFSLCSSFSFLSFEASTPAQFSAA